MDWSLEMTDPQSVGLSSEQLDKISRRMEGYVHAGYSAGIISLVARHGKIAHAHVCGMQDREANRSLSFDSIFRMYSNTKLVCAVAVLQLYERGLFQLEDAVSKYIPAFEKLRVEREGKREELKRPVSIHDLLVHIGGLSYDLVHHARRERWTHDEFIEHFVERPLVQQPGEAWHYSASNDVLGILIEKVCDKPLADVLDQHIFQPLDMQETAWFVPADKLDRFGPVYRYSENGLNPDAELNAGIFDKAPSFFSLGGGLVSTTDDYLKFSQMLLNGGTFNGQRLLSSKSVALMAADHLPPGHPDIDINKMRYGLSVEVLADLGRTQRLGSVGEFGWGGAASTQVWIDPQEGMISLIMMQLFGGVEPIQKTFRTMSVAAIM